MQVKTSLVDSCLIMVFMMCLKLQPDTDVHPFVHGAWNRVSVCYSITNVGLCAYW